MKLKNWLLVIISIIVILLIILIALLTSQKEENNTNEQNYERQDGAEEVIIEYNNLEKVKDRNTFFTVTSCVDKYLTQVYSEDSQNIYNLLSDEYIMKNGITVNNILDKLDTYDKMQIFSATTMYEVNNTKNISTYYVEGTIRDDIFEQEDTERSPIYIAVQLDKINRTYAIIPKEKAPLDSNLAEVTKEKIEQKGRNTYTSANISDTQMASIYLANYKELLENNLTEAYNKLQEEYKQKRFNNQEIFKQYIKTRKNHIYNLRVESLSTYAEEDGTNVYNMKDQYGYRYILKETAIMEYTIELDDYTLENKHFEDQYEKCNDRDKGLLNADKFFRMLNMQDYASAYAVLDETFKENNFKTLLDFEKYMKSKIFIFNKVNYKEYSSQIPGIQNYKAVLTDVTEENKKEIAINIVMKLLEGTDFVMSFSID